MKILWITNSPFPAIFDEIKSQNTEKGWTYSAAYAFLNQFPEIELAVASVYDGGELKQIQANRIIHYLVPNRLTLNVNNTKIDFIWEQIKGQFNPDVVHIHGSEYAHSYSFIRVCGSEKVVVSIQGLVSVIEKYYYGGISKMNLLRSITIRDILRFDTVFSQQINMRVRGKYEILLIKNVNHVIGRTTWDKNHVWAINPSASYHFCNETLRSSFYHKQWSIENCEKYSIFISQAYYPLKGFQQLLKALPLVLRNFPETRVYVAGNNFFVNKGIRINGFASYINSLIKVNNLSDHIYFTGLLNEEEMCKRFLDSHLFISASSIENSSNSVGEAQLLGVPCIASYVGGTADLIEHGETGLLYRFEEVEMLAANICKLFSDDDLLQNISLKARQIAAKRHDKVKNAINLQNIYLKIMNETTIKTSFHSGELF